jgi:hypothetical protein
MVMLARRLPIYTNPLFDLLVTVVLQYATRWDLETIPWRPLDMFEICMIHMDQFILCTELHVRFYRQQGDLIYLKDLDEYVESYV